MSEQQLVFHHLQHSQSQRIFWLLEELGAPYELKLHERYSSGPRKGGAKETLRESHPLGKSPQIITPQGRVITESSAIATYLIDNYDTAKKFQGDAGTGNDYIRDESLSSISNSNLSLIMTLDMVFEALVKQSPFFIRWLVSGISAKVTEKFTGPELQKYFQYLSDQLGQQEYFMGTNPGRADFMLSWNFDFCTQRKYIDLKKYPSLEKWHARCQAREAWKRSVSKGNGYDLVNGLI